MARAEAERNAARHDASMAHSNSKAVGSAKAKVDSELARVQNALAERRLGGRQKTRPAAWPKNGSLCF